MRARAICVRKGAVIFGVMVSSAAHADHPIGGASTSTAGPIITIPASTLSKGAVVAGLRVTYARPDAYRDSELVDLAGRHIHAHSTDYTLITHAALAYGLTDHFTVGVALPYIRRDDLREGEHHHHNGAAENTVVEQGSIDGVGDLTLMGQYQFAHDNRAGWGVALLGGVKLPTGSTHERNSEAERFETEHQPGTGSIDPLVGLAASKTWGRVSVDGNFLYQISTRGAQRTELGDRANLNLALSYSLAGNDHHDDDGGAAAHGHDAWSVVIEANSEWEGRQRVDGERDAASGGRVIYLSPGARYSTASGWSASASVGLPLWQDIRPSHPDNSLRVVASIGKRL